MSIFNSRLVRIAAGVGVTSWVLAGSTAAPGLAVLGSDDSDVVVTNTETIQIYTDPTGKVSEQRVYEQLVLTGTGDVTIENPVETDGLRNLEGFTGYDVEDGKEIISASVDGEAKYRSVSTFNGELPLVVSVRYFLDGDEVSPDDVVGEDGHLEVRYRVENVTGETQQVTVKNGRGGTVTRNVEVVLPMVGSLTTVLPSTFTDVDSQEANMAGDGRGGTKMSFTMTLFPPIGSPVVEFGYEADIVDGEVPRATISALPVNPLQSPSFKGGAKSLNGGAQTGIDLTSGATEIDENLLRLRDGAQELSAGLLKLYAGAGQLSDGLGEAVPGAAQLSDGSSDLADGANQLSDGINQADAGANELDDGAGRLNDGATRLADGAIQLDDGTLVLKRGAAELADGAGELSDGAGDLADGAKQVDDGADQLSDGAGDLADGAKKVNRGTKKLSDGAGELADGTKALNKGAKKLRNGLGALSTGAGDLDTGADTLAAGQKQLEQGLALLYQGVDTLPEDVQAQLSANPKYLALLGALDTVITGIGHPDDAADAGTLLGGINKLQYGMRYPGTTDCQVALGGGTPSACGAMDGVDLVAELLDGGVAKIETQLIPAATGVYNYVVATSGGTCPALVDGLPPATAFAAGGVCQAAAASLAGYAAPPGYLAGIVPGFENGGLRYQAQAASTALSGIASKVDAELLAAGAGLDQLRRALYSGTLAQCADDPTACGMAEALTLVRQGIPTLVDELTNNISATLLANIGVPTKGCDPTATLRCAAAALSAGADELADGTQQVLNGSLQLSDGADQLADGTARLASGATLLAAGTVELSGGTAQLADGAVLLKNGTLELGDGTQLLLNGARQLSDGSIRLADGTTILADGTVKLKDGTSQLADGSSDLADGTAQLKDGTSQLAGGTGQLADGGSQLSDGANLLSSGMLRLFDGLIQASDGSLQLRDGLGQASKGAPQIPEGATKLSKKGTQKLVDAGSNTAVDYGVQYAQIRAGADRAQTDAMAFGAPEGAIGLTAYTYEIRGAQGEDTKNWNRGVAAVVVFGLGAGVLLLRRFVI